MADKTTGKLTKYILKNSINKERNLKYDFMPELLEIIERPSHMAGKVIIAAIACLLVFAIVWANLAKMDVAVSGSGYITTEAEMSTITSLTGGIIEKVYAFEGDYVEQGDILLELDASEIRLEIDILKKQIELLAIQKEITEKFYNDFNSEADAGDYAEEYQYAVNRIIYDNQIFKLQLEQYPDSNESMVLQYKAELNEELLSINENINNCENELLSQQLLLERMTVTAPVAGNILSAGAVYEGQTIMNSEQLFVIAPNDSEYIFEGYLADKYISDVEVEDMVQIKLQAYSYSDYGSVSGKITYISPSAFKSENGENVYTVKVELNKEECNKNINFVSGLSGSMEINIGKRSVMDYFLEPILGNLNDSLKEK